MKQVFVYAGQGTQYYHMGKKLYHNNLVFKQAMDELDRIVEGKTNRSIINAIYNTTSNTQSFDNILDSHPAIFCLGYSLTQVLVSAGFKPDAVIGHSLGEYIAATVSGMLALDDALSLVIEQARLLDQYEKKGSLVCIVDSVDLFHKRPEVFTDVFLGGVNFSNSFFISGYKDDMALLKEKLSNEDILSIELPVNYGFHSTAIDSIKDKYMTYANHVPVKSPSIPMYSSTLASIVDDSVLEQPSEYLWQMVRGKIDFESLMSNTFTDTEAYFFVDLSASGSLANVLKYMDVGKNRYKCGAMLNQFGKDLDTVNALMSQLKNLEHR